MLGAGTLINTAAIVIGGGVGLIIKNRLTDNMQNSLMKALGLATMFIGLSGALTGLLSVSPEGVIATQGTMLMVFSLVIGTIIGELLRIEHRLNQLGHHLKTLLRAGDDSSFAHGFVTNTLVVCVGAMAIVGSLQEGLTGDFSMLFAKALLDLMISLVFASTLGVGVLFAAAPLFLYQGGITLLARFVEPFMSDVLISNLSYVGSILIFAIGLNLLFKLNVKVGNMIPALLVPIVFEVIR